MPNVVDLSNPVSLDLTSDGLDADLHAGLNSLDR